MAAAAPDKTVVRLFAHPNDLDRKRIERGLKNRRRYRYVSPQVEKVAGGYRITSPCCSRNIDPEGGVIDVALLLYDSANVEWHLYRKDHSNHAWQLHSSHERLVNVLEYLSIDPERMFWQ